MRLDYSPALKSRRLLIDYDVRFFSSHHIAKKLSVAILFVRLRFYKYALNDSDVNQN